MDQPKPLSITQEQFNLLSNSLRIRIMYALKDRAMTAKQVADQLSESPGNVHYHVQKLYKGGLIELVETRETSGILEKYYCSKADRFEFDSPNGNMDVQGQTRTRALAYIKVTESELQEFMMELTELLSKWECRDSSPDSFEVVCDSSIILPNSHQ